MGVNFNFTNQWCVASYPVTALRIIILMKSFFEKDQKIPNPRDWKDEQKKRVCKNYCKTLIGEKQATRMSSLPQIDDIDILLEHFKGVSVKDLFPWTICPLYTVAAFVYFHRQTYFIDIYKSITAGKEISLNQVRRLVGAIVDDDLKKNDEALPALPNTSNALLRSLRGRLIGKRSKLEMRSLLLNAQEYHLQEPTGDTLASMRWYFEVHVSTVEDFKDIKELAFRDILQHKELMDQKTNERADAEKEEEEEIPMEDSGIEVRSPLAKSTKRARPANENSEDEQTSKRLCLDVDSTREVQASVSENSSTQTKSHEIPAKATKSSPNLSPSSSSSSSSPSLTPWSSFSTSTPLSSPRATSSTRSYAQEMFEPTEVNESGTLEKPATNVTTEMVAKKAHDLAFEIAASLGLRPQSTPRKLAAFVVDVQEALLAGPSGYSSWAREEQIPLEAEVGSTKATEVTGFSKSTPLETMTMTSESAVKVEGIKESHGAGHFSLAESATVLVQPAAIMHQSLVSELSNVCNEFNFFESDGPATPSSASFFHEPEQTQPQAQMTEIDFTREFSATTDRSMKMCEDAHVEELERSRRSNIQMDYKSDEEETDKAAPENQMDIDVSNQLNTDTLYDLESSTIAGYAGNAGYDHYSQLAQAGLRESMDLMEESSMD